MRGQFRKAIVALAVFLISTSYANAGVPCTFDQVSLDPQSVIEPCSLIIDDKATRANDRGFALYIRGRGYHNTKRLDLARLDYDAAIKLTPKNEELLVSRANISFREGLADEGVTFLQKVLALNPKNGHALRTMGALLGDASHREEAERFYSMALEDDHHDGYALLFRSGSYLKRRDFAKALNDADALVAIPPSDINLQGYLDQRGDKKDFHIIALVHRSKVHDSMGRSDLAEADLKSAVGYSRSNESLSALGEFLAYKPSREDDALAVLDEAISLGSRSPRTYYAKGQVLVQKNRQREALDAFDRAASLDPRFGYAFLMSARMHRALDETDAAVDDIASAVSVDPDVRAQVMGSMNRYGYWHAGTPTSLTPELKDALRACMLDKRCN